MLLAIGFVAGLALGFPLGVLSYLATTAFFQKAADDRLRKRVISAQQTGINIGRETANKLHRMRSLHGPTLSETPVADEQMEDILGTGPNGGGR